MSVLALTACTFVLRRARGAECKPGDDLRMLLPGMRRRMVVYRTAASASASISFVCTQAPSHPAHMYFGWTFIFMSICSVRHRVDGGAARTAPTLPDGRKVIPDHLFCGL